MFLRAMNSHGIAFSGSLSADGKIHRFSTTGKGKDKSGWYVLHLDHDFAAGAFGDWKNGDGSHKWLSIEERLLSPDQQARHRKHQEDVDRQIQHGYELAAQECRTAWDTAAPAPADFPYLMKKGVPAHGLRVHHDGYLLIPMMDSMGQIRSLQRIYPDGSKYNWTGGEKQGHYFTIPGSSEIYICEGYATGATIHQATGGTVVVAFDAGNLYPVTETVKAKFPQARITICADNDQWKPEKGNAGVEKAKKAGKRFKCPVIFPEFLNTTTKPTDFNDLAALEGIETVRLQIKGPAIDEAQDPWEGQIYTLKDAYAPREPLKFIVNGLFTLPSLSILYGAPGTLKSMLLADLAVCVAAGIPWLSRNVIQSPVLWIDLDNGKRRTAERFAALGRARGLPESIPLYYASMPEPWLNADNNKDIDALTNRIIKNKIQLVCIDNLGLMSMSVEEKSDAMIPIMANMRLLVERTGAAGSIIHHQRKGTSASGRAGDSLRGHSGIESAVDLALLVTREECGNFVTVSSTKTRDVEVLPFGAAFRYDHKYGTNELQEASFVKYEMDDTTSDMAVERTIIAICKDQPLITQKQVVALAKKELQAGVNRIRFIYKQLKDSKRIQTYGSDE